MMAGGKVCTSCGLTTDASGNLIVDTNAAAWPLTTCKDTSGTPIYCGSDGALRGPAEKFSQSDRVGKNFITKDGITSDTQPHRMTHFVSQDNVLHDISSDGTSGANVSNKAPLTVTIKNPSKCLPFNLHLEAGVSHARIDYTGSPGSFEVELGTQVDISGFMSGNGTIAGGHQIWGFDTGTDSQARSITFDTMGARATLVPPPAAPNATKFVIAPGGTGTIVVHPMMRLDLHGQSDVADIQSYTVDLNWWGSND